MNGLVLVAAGGALGAAARHLVSQAALRWLGPAWPWGTLAANLAGALLMGALVGWLAARGDGGRELRLFLGVGLLGGFTTFSAFSLEAAMMIERRDFTAAGLYAGGSVALCVAALFAGLFAARRAFA